MVDWPEITGFEDTERSVLEDQIEDPMSVILQEYPRIHNRIVLLWGSQELADQLNRWLFVDQDGRRGFSKRVGTALLSIAITHERIFNVHGSVVKRSFKDVW